MHKNIYSDVQKNKGWQKTGLWKKKEKNKPKTLIEQLQHKYTKNKGIATKPFEPQH